MSNVVILHADPFWVSPYVMTAFVALKEKGVDFEVRTVNLGTREHRTEPYRSSSLTARVPALLHDGFWLSESSAIAEYIDDVFAGPGTSPLFPTDPRQRARARQVMAFVRSDIDALRAERSSETVFYKLQCPPLSPAGRRAADKLVQLATALVADRADTAFGQWSIADVDLAMALQRMLANGDELPPQLRAYAETQWSRPSVKAFVDHTRAPFVPYNY